MQTLLTFTCTLIKLHTHAFTCTHSHARTTCGSTLYVLQTREWLRSGTRCRPGANEDKRHIYIKADVKCENIGARIQSHTLADDIPPGDDTCKSDDDLPLLFLPRLLSLTTPPRSHHHPSARPQQTAITPIDR